MCIEEFNQNWEGCPANIGSDIKAQTIYMKNERLKYIN
jgi:hypothetical protein